MHQTVFSCSVPLCSSSLLVAYCSRKIKFFDWLSSLQQGIYSRLEHVCYDCFVVPNLLLLLIWRWIQMHQILFYDKIYKVQTSSQLVRVLEITKKIEPQKSYFNAQRIKNLAWQKNTRLHIHRSWEKMDPGLITWVASPRADADVIMVAAGDDELTSSSSSA